MEKRYEITVRSNNEDQLTDVDETLLKNLLTASLEDEDIDVELEIEPINAHTGADD